MKIFNCNDDDELPTTMKHKDAPEMNVGGLLYLLSSTSSLSLSLSEAINFLLCYYYYFIGYRLASSLFILLLLQSINILNNGNEIIDF